jgi:hypothetical protein
MRCPSSGHENRENAKFCEECGVPIRDGFMLRRVVDAYQHFQGPRVAMCPETGTLVDIEFDATYAAVTYVLGAAQLSVARCSRWPESRHCDQTCLAGIDGAWAQEHGLLTRTPATSRGPGSSR